jgi:hypothetical protein
MAELPRRNEIDLHRSGRANQMKLSRHIGSVGVAARFGLEERTPGAVTRR